VAGAAIMSPVLGLYWLPGDWRVGLLEAAYHQADALLAARQPWVEVVVRCIEGFPHDRWGLWIIRVEVN
jgi:hypothetical protein